MNFLNSFLNLVVPPTSFVMLAFSWPALCFVNACERLYHNITSDHQNMENKVVIITGASSGIGEQIAYEYAKRRANLVLVARRENRLHGISANARRIGAKHVLILPVDVVKEDECRLLVQETVTYFGRVDHLVNTVSLGHTFYFQEVTDTSVFPILLDVNFWGNVYPTLLALPYLHQSKGQIVVNASVENWLPLPRMSLYAAAKAALVNFFETLRFEVRDEVGITIATHGWLGIDMSTRGNKFMLEEGAEMQWKEEREVHVRGGAVEEYARMIVDGACRGDSYVKFPSWYDVFMLFRVFTPNVLSWTFHLLLAPNSRTTSYVGTGRGRHISEGTHISEGGIRRTSLEGTASQRKLLPGSFTFSQPSYNTQQYKYE